MPYLQGAQPTRIMIPSHAVLVAKEEVPSLVFPNEPLKLSDVHQRQRDEKVRRAMQLGNTEHTKCRILFKDDRGIKYVETTVWSFDKQNVVLKSGTVIPMARVLDIEFH